MSRIENGEARAVSAAPAWLLGLYLLLKPFYFWGSGLPQVSDLVLALLVIVVAFEGFSHRRLVGAPSGFRSAVIAFVYYVALVNLVAALILSDTGFLRTTLFYVYNGVVAMSVAAVAGRLPERTRRVVFISALASMFLQLLLLAASGALGGVGRQMGNFNNPNQLGAFAVFVFGVALVSARDTLSDAIAVAAGLLAAGYLATLSLSRAALLAVPVLLVAYMLYLQRGDLPSRARVAMALAIGVSLIVALAFVEKIENSEMWRSVANRFGKEDSLEARGFARVLDHPEFWITGGGEGANYRFGSSIEVHSGMATLIYAYGAIGLFLFLRILWTSARGASATYKVVLLATLVYGVGHQQLRHTVMWVLLGLGAAGISARASREDTDDASWPRLPRPTTSFPRLVAEGKDTDD